MNPVILIPARLKSTRLPNKPLALIAGDAMIVHVWRRAMEAGIGPVYVACDDKTIEKVVNDAGGQTVMTGLDHESGSDRIYEALQKIDPGKKFDVIINVQGDVPTIDPALIRTVLKPLADTKVDIATLACLIKNKAELTDPSVVKPVFEGKVTAGIVRAQSFTRNPAQDGTPLYHHIGIYAYKRKALERFVSLPPSLLEKSEKLEQLRAIEDGMRIDVALVDTVPLGVDTAEHLEQARKVLGA